MPTDSMIVENIPLAVHIARRYFRFGARFGLDADDVIQVAYLGLVEGCRRFDPARGVKPSVFLWPYVSGYIFRAVEQAQPTGLKERAKARARETQRDLGPDPSFVPYHLLGGGGDGSADPDPLADERAEGPVDALIREERAAIVDAALRSFRDERLGQLFRLRFGLDGEDPLTLSEVGERLGISRERVRQIETEALPLLRARLARMLGEAELAA